MLVTTTGRFSFIDGGEHPLRKAVDAWREQGETSPVAAARDPVLLDAQTVAAQELITAQEAAGVDLLGDGAIPIYDEWYAWAGALEGVEIEPSIRYLDTNTYYHRWRLTGRPQRLGPGPAVTAYQRAASLTAKPVKPCLFGPYTLWSCALKDDESASAFDAFSDIWADEIADLSKKGAQYVQLDESVLLRPQHRGNVQLAARAVERIAIAAPEVTLILHLACGTVGDLLAPLLALPVGGLGLDFTDTHRAPNLAALAQWCDDKVLQAGVVHGREIVVETEDYLEQTLEAITAQVAPDQCLVAPSTGLHYLPRLVAFEKLTALSTAAHAFASETVAQA